MTSDRHIKARERGIPSLGVTTLHELCRQHRVRQLDLFGSAVGEKFDPARSDLDFVVTFEPMSPAEYAAAYFSLREALERLSGHAVDLLTDAALANPYLRRSIDAQRRVIFPSA
jgi:hypothetical protein